MSFKSELSENPGFNSSAIKTISLDHYPKWRWKQKIFWNHHLGDTHSQKATIWHGACQFLIDFIWLKEVDCNPTIPHSGSFNNGAITRVYTQPFNIFYGKILGPSSNSKWHYPIRHHSPLPSACNRALWPIWSWTGPWMLDLWQVWDSKDLVLTLNKKYKNKQVGVS